MFDKTGTITYGTPVVQDIIPLNSNIKRNDGDRSKGYTKDNILFEAASLEQMSSHPSAQGSMIFLYHQTFMKGLVWELKDILMENILW